MSTQDVVKVTHGFLTADAEVPVKLLPGVVGKVFDVDKDGDAYVDFVTLFKHLTKT